MIFRRLLVIVPIAAAAISLSCGPTDVGTADRELYDLTSDLAFSRRISETAGLDLGAPGSVTSLGFGWSHIERSGAGDHFRWALGEGSRLRFDLVFRRDLELEMLARPYLFDDARSQAVEVSVNGSKVGSFEMQPGWHRYRVAVPAVAQRPGENVLDLLYRHWWTPEAGADGPRRRLAVAWKRVGIVDPLPAVDEPEAIPDESSLFLPAGNRVDFFLEIPRGSSIRIDEALPAGVETGKLLLTEATDDGGESVLFEAREAVVAIDSDLLGGRAGVVRLSLAVEPDAAPAEGEGFLLTRPRVVSSERGTAELVVEPQSSAVLPAERRPNVLLYLVDTLRTDAVGAYAPGQTTSPSFDSFAADATLFKNAVGQSSWTRASVASLFTGLLPQRHGAVDRLDILSADAVTLAETLGEAGYESAAFITNPNVTAKFGFAQGFDDFFHIRTYRASDEVNERVFGWLEENVDARPFFLYVHTMDPHHPYLPPESTRPAFAPTEQDMRALTRLLAVTPPPPDLVEQVDRLRALYDAAARFNDHSFGDLIELLDQRGLLEETIVVFVSDHGEEFHEHGDWQHGKNLHVETLNVPMAIRFPDVGRNREIDTVTGHVDVLPTLLDYLGLPIPASVDGRSVLPLLTDSAQRPSTPDQAFAHLSLDGHQSVAVVHREWKLIVETTARGGHRYRLYRWTSDPGEQHDLAARRPILVGYLESLIDRKIAAGAPALTREEAELDDELERSLKALGYLQ